MDGVSFLWGKTFFAPVPIRALRFSNIEISYSLVERNSHMDVVAGADSFRVRLMRNYSRGDVRLPITGDNHGLEFVQCSGRNQL